MTSPHPCHCLLLSDFFILVILMGVKYLTVILICTSLIWWLMRSNSFSCIYLPFGYLLCIHEKDHQILCPFKICICLFYYWIVKVPFFNSLNSLFHAPILAILKQLSHTCTHSFYRFKIWNGEWMLEIIIKIYNSTFRIRL